MKVAYISSEVYPFAKTGGLADVSGALPQELSKIHVQVKLFMPNYKSINHFNHSISFTNFEKKILVGNKTYSVKYFRGFLPGTNIEIYFIDSPHHFHRDKLYNNKDDEWERFVLFSKAVLELFELIKWTPDILHCNDWQTSLIPLLAKDKKFDRLSKTKSILTIHNMGYQGVFPYKITENFFPNYNKALLDKKMKFNFLKCGIDNADLINTVSKTYAKEILTSEFGEGLEDALSQQSENLYGIVNGIDYNEWNPETDKLIPFNYSKLNLSNKYKCKKLLLDKTNLRLGPDKPLIGLVSRMASQKGFGIISDVLSELVKLDAQWIIIGSGEQKYEDMFINLAYNYSHKVYAFIGYDNKFAHLVEAGSDIFLMPSRYEPCGLNQLYSLKYGAVPVVRKTGGLADTVFDWDEHLALGTDNGAGFSFEEYSGKALIDTLKRALGYFNDKEIWYKIQYNGMSANYSWKSSAVEYLSLYKKLIN